MWNGDSRWSRDVLLIGPLDQPSMENFAPVRTSTTSSRRVDPSPLPSAASISLKHMAKPASREPGSLGEVGAGYNPTYANKVRQYIDVRGKTESRRSMSPPAPRSKTGRSADRTHRTEPASRSEARRAEQPAQAYGGSSVLPDLTTRNFLGSRLKALRSAKGLTLQEVADATGLSRTFVGMVEQGKSEIAVARLLRIADFYGVTIHDLVGTETDPAIELVPLQIARKVPTGEPGVSLWLLATRSSHISQPFIVELAPHTQLDGLAHSGDEWIVCAEGTTRVRVAEAEHDLRLGDSLFYPGRLTHGYFNHGDDPARIVGSVVRLGS